MWLTAILLASTVAVKSQDIGALLGPLLGGGGAGGGGIGNILSGLGGGGGKAPDIGSLLQLGAGLLNKNGGGAPMLPLPGAAPTPTGGGGPSNIAVPDYSDYDGHNVDSPSPAEVRRRRKERRRRNRQREKEQRRQRQRNKKQRRRGKGVRQQRQRPSPSVSNTPNAITPPSSLTWMKERGGPASTRINGDYDYVEMSGAVPQFPPPPSQFTPVGRSQQRAVNTLYHNPNARVFVTHEATLPPPRIQSPYLPQFAQNWNAAPPTTPLPVYTPFALPTIQAPTVSPLNPKLLAHNTARMIREIASFSDVHHGANEDYGAVQTLMEAFFESVADPKPAVSLQDPNRLAALFQPQYDGTELGANRPLTNKLFESDMVLTVEQMKAIVLASREQRRGGLRRGKRKVITGAVYRWPRAPIPYRFNGGDENWRNLIRSALRHWESETCVRWEENGRGNDYVIFFRGSGCYSSVGRTGGSQMISIGYGCEDKGIVTHEVGHSLGFWHEQSRPDRDNYITLNKQFIIHGTDGNFERRTTQEIEDMGLPYDLGSVMHYGPNAFTSDWNHITIRTNDQNYQKTIGQRAEPSFIDVKQVNRLYCNGICAPLPCENGGYADPNNCLKCKCPKGLDGMRCELLPQVGCGGELQATTVWQELGHRGKRRCFWRIRTDNARIRLILSNVNYRCETTCRAYVEVKHNSDFQQAGFRTCCNDREIEVTSEQAEVLIIADSSELDYETGFNLRYIQDSGRPLPKPPPSIWIPGSENRGFRGAGPSGPIEKFILNVIPKVRDPNRPWESIASIVAEYSLASLFGIKN